MEIKIHSLEDPDISNLILNLLSNHSIRLPCPHSSLGGGLRPPLNITPKVHLNYGWIIDVPLKEII